MADAAPTHKLAGIMSKPGKAELADVVPALLACGTVIQTDAFVSGGTALRANAVVATCVVFVPAAAVGAVGVPVSAGDPNKFVVLTSTVGFPPTPD